MWKLFFLTAAAIFTAEALVMLFVELFAETLALPVRIFLDSSLLMVCVFPTLYLLIFKEMTEQIHLRQQAEQTQNSWNRSLELVVEERTERLQRANEDLLVEVQGRAKAAMALRTALNESRAGKEQMLGIVNAVRDALVVVDSQWRVNLVNQAAEVMFSASAYDLQGRSLKDFLQSWAQDTAALEHFFSRTGDVTSTYLIPPESDFKKSHPVQMRFGAELEWEGQPSLVLLFYFREDLPRSMPQKIHAY